MEKLFEFDLRSELVKKLGESVIIEVEKAAKYYDSKIDSIEQIKGSWKEVNSEKAIEKLNEGEYIIILYDDDSQDLYHIQEEYRGFINALPKRTNNPSLKQPKVTKIYAWFNED